MATTNLSYAASSDLMADLLFTVRYASKSLYTIAQYSLLGAAIGFGGSYLFAQSLNKFAEENHEAVDFTDQYVANEEQYLQFSRNQHFNKEKKPISEFIPYYSAAVGAGALGFFALHKVSRDYSSQLQNEREVRKLDIV
jgi:hypothetical protein